MRRCPTADDLLDDEEEKGICFGAMRSLPVNRQRSVKIDGFAGYGTHRDRDFQAVGISRRYRWGGGF